ncbi:MAG: hypothetical protein AABZ06_03735 [Bdellovibrionota bacterium]
MARLDVVPGSRYTSGRAAALGDAFLPLGEDGAAGLFYNPAIIARRGSRGVEPVNLGIYANNGYVQNFDLNFYKVAELSRYATTLQAHPGIYFSSGASLMPAAYFRGFALGLLMQSEVGAVANGDQTITYRSLYQFIPAVGGGIRLASGIVRLGYSLQWVNQASGQKTEAVTADPLGYNQGLSQGSALSHNLGFALTLPYTNLPSINVVARNVLNAKFSEFSLVPLARNTVGAPATERTTYDASFSLLYRIAGGTYFNIAFVYRDFSNITQLPMLARLVGGLELSLGDLLFIRSGYRGGYTSLGIGLRRKKAEFNFTWYGEEVGGGYKVQQDSRYMLHYQVRAF